MLRRHNSMENGVPLDSNIRPKSQMRELEATMCQVVNASPFPQLRMYLRLVAHMGGTMDECTCEVCFFVPFGSPFQY